MKELELGTLTIRYSDEQYSDDERARIDKLKLLMMVIAAVVSAALTCAIEVPVCKYLSNIQSSIHISVIVGCSMVVAVAFLAIIYRIMRDYIIYDGDYKNERKFLDWACTSGIGGVVKSENGIQFMYKDNPFDQGMDLEKFEKHLGVSKGSLVIKEKYVEDEVLHSILDITQYPNCSMTVQKNV